MTTGNNEGKRSRTLLNLYFVKEKRIGENKDEIGHGNDQGKSWRTLIALKIKQ